MLTRRQFLKAAGGAVVSLTVFRSLALWSDAGKEETVWTGPRVREGLTYQEDKENIRVLYDREVVLITNPAGMELMKKADGSRTLEELMAADPTGNSDEAIADFFLTLGQSGWLSNRLEVRKYAVES